MQVKGWKCANSKSRRAFAGMMILNLHKVYLFFPPWKHLVVIWLAGMWGGEFILYFVWWFSFFFHLNFEWCSWWIENSLSLVVAEILAKPKNILWPFQRKFTNLGCYTLLNIVILKFIHYGSYWSSFDLFLLPVVSVGFCCCFSFNFVMIIFIMC